MYDSRNFEAAPSRGIWAEANLEYAPSWLGTSKEYVKLIDGDEFITLWQQYYAKMTDEDKNRLPLRRIAFLGSNE